MKKRNIILFFVILQTISISVFAQIINIYTPKGSAIEASDKSSSNTPTSIQNAENNASSFLTNTGWTNLVTKLEGASLAYNCHSYAWYKSEGGTPDYWINSYTQAQINAFDRSSQNSTPPSSHSNLPKYWNDGSYMVAPQWAATKVYYGSCWAWDSSIQQWVNDCDHSAVKLPLSSTGGQEIYVSKWGPWGLYQHPANIAPFDIANPPVNGRSPVATWPNPVSDMLNIEIDAIAATMVQGRNLVYDIRLYDDQGNLLRQTTSKGGAVQFNVSGLPVGIYYLHIYDGVNNTPDMQQIVVER